MQRRDFHGNGERERGWQVSGLDANPTAVEICRKKSLSAQSGTFSPETLDRLPEKNFDLLCLNDAIEHFTNPLAALELSRKILKDGGFIMITTPNMKSLLARIFQVKPKEHLFYFTEETLGKILRKANFRTETILELGRRRDIAAMDQGATFENKSWLLLSNFLRWTKMDVLASVLLDAAFREELLALAQKAQPK